MEKKSRKVHPSEVSGTLRAWRTRVGGILGIVFLALPWIRIHGRPAFLFDIPARRFEVFGRLFFAQDIPLLVYVAGTFILSILLLTAVFGRVWCGWACPQTVFTDLVFRRIEHWIEGDAVTRRRRDSAPLNAGGLIRKTAKWASFGAVSAVISHSLLAYFVGTERLKEMIAAGPAASPEAFLAMSAILLFVAFDFGWFRERFCSHICPYGRFQTVLLDEKSWVVAYDSTRKDCIDCRKCVSACPAGIDIREGLQLECIACTACIDACAPVMKKLGKPLGLIRYSTAADAATRPGLRDSIFRPRPMVYAAVLLALSGGLVGAVAAREDVDVAFSRASGNPYDLVRTAGNGDAVLNRFSVDLQNRTYKPCAVSWRASDPKSGVEIVSDEPVHLLGPAERKQITLFLRFPRANLRAGTLKTAIQARFQWEGSEPPERRELEAKLVGPYR